MSRRSPLVSPNASLHASLLSGLMAALLIAAPAAAQTGVREPIVPAGQTASATLTPGIKVGNFVFASGQLGMRRDAPDTTVVGQSRIALESTKKVFEAAGTTMAHVAKCTVYLIDAKDFGGMNQAYREFFPTTPPARTTVVVAALVSPGAKVEIECMAVMPK
ncbi:MAG: RidA family protein [Gemmatimonadota bacterium]